MRRISQEDQDPVLVSLPERAYRYLRELILSGSLAANTAVRQEEVATQLGVSRLPVREALRRLSSEGLVVLRPQRGYFVAAINLDEMDDVLQVQAILEERAGFAAALNRTEQEVEALRRILDKLDSMASSKSMDIEEFAHLNAEFHERIYAASGRPWLSHMLTVIQSNVERYVRLGAGLSTDLRASNAEHHDIFDAFKKKNPEALALFCRLHRERTRIRLVEHVAEQAKKAVNP
jgi:DNA-binding GntR family transcriptional regulator